MILQCLDDTQLAVLIELQCDENAAYLVSIVLEYSLDGNDVVGVHVLGSAHNAECAIPYYLQVLVTKLNGPVIRVTSCHRDYLTPDLLNYTHEIMCWNRKEVPSLKAALTGFFVDIWG